MNKNFSHTGVRKEQLPRFNFVALLALTSFIFLILTSSASADPYSDCTRYGNCKPINPSTVFNNNTATVNSTVYWLGMNGLQNPWIIKTSTFLDFNGTKLNNEFVKYNNFSTFNTTYDNFWLSNATIWSAINNRIQLNNATINSAINFAYNHTSIVLTNVSSSYVPYSGALGNVDLNRKNITNIFSISTENATSIGVYSLAYGRARNTATIKTNGIGSFALGSANGLNSSINATGEASFAGGRSAGTASGIQSSGVGSFIWGFTNPNYANSSIIASSPGAAVFGGSSRINSTLSSTGGTNLQAFVVGSASGDNSILTATATGCFSSGIANGTNSLISCGGAGSFVHGLSATTGGYIITTGIGNFIHGSENISVSGNNNIVYGKMINVTASNTLAFGVGTTTSVIPASNQFWTNALSNLTGDAITPRLNVTNVTVDQLFNIKFTTLPTCNVASNGSVGRNLTGLYDCPNGNGTWVKLG